MKLQHSTKRHEVGWHVVPESKCRNPNDLSLWDRKETKLVWAEVHRQRSSEHVSFCGCFSVMLQEGRRTVQKQGGLQIDTVVYKQRDLSYSEWACLLLTAMIRCR